MIKKLVISALTCFVVSSYAQASELYSFNDIANSINNGNALKIVVNTKKCLTAPLGGIVVRSIEAKEILLMPNYLVFTNSQIISKGAKPWLQTLNGRVDADSVTISIKGVGFSETEGMSISNTSCKLKDGGVRFFN